MHFQIWKLLIFSCGILFINGGTWRRVWVKYMKVRPVLHYFEPKQSKVRGIEVESVVILVISRWIESDYWLLMTAIGNPGFAIADMAIWFQSQHKTRINVV